MSLLFLNLKKNYEFHKSLYEENNINLDGWWEIDEKQYGYLFGNGFETFEPGDSGYPTEIQDFRLVFWFDN